MKSNFLCRGVLALATAFWTLSPAQAEQIGYGRLLVNDFIGDGKDRWRSGSIAASHVLGRDWSGELPYEFGQIVEVRVLGQVIAPSNLNGATAGDRAYAGALSLGAHTHFARQGFDFAIGGDLVIVGPQTGLGNLQDWLHKRVSMPGSSSTVLANQIGNDVSFTGVAEIGRSFDLAENVNIRPFAEARVGDETLIRTGFDLVLGQFGQNGMLVRDPVSGQRYETIQGDGDGYSFMVGADVAYVDNSIYFPASFGVSHEEQRTRVRIGIQHRNENRSLYYGASWLSPEFKGQAEGQVVGAARIKFHF